MSNSTTYDVIIVGGGLAGLAASILLARRKYNVLLLEKEYYPKHKVCGEYISMESKPFLQSLGVSVDDSLPVINKLQVTDTKGNELNASLPQGGFGISRYMLDAQLATIAEKAGVTLLTRTRADSISYTADQFTVTAGGNTYTAKLACGTWGKRSNMDVKWQRSFLKEKNNALSNYVGIKYHISHPLPRDVVSLHNFTNGYCGISPIEDDKYCLCYLTTAANLHSNGNDIKKMEQQVLMKNPLLEEVFNNAVFHYDTPLAISQVSFEQKEQVYDHVLLLGDAAGMITPLCGNGMSMALHAAKLADGIIDSFLKGRSTRLQMEQDYTRAWKQVFSRRLTLGRVVQNNFGRDMVTSLFIKTAKAIPYLQKVLINGTSGKPF